jgi:anti-sigma B factor antagonist
MTTADFQLIKLNMVDDVVLVEVLSKDLLNSEVAQKLGAELYTVAAQDWAKRILVNFRRTVYLSSTGFGILLQLLNEAKKAGHLVKFCNMHKDVRIGADIIGLGKFVEFYDSEKAALKAFSSA